MHVVLVMIESVGLIVGSLLTAFLFCYGLSLLFRGVRHPEWGPLLLLPLIPLAFILETGEFFRMTAILIVLFVLPFWIEGRSWRASHA